MRTEDRTDVALDTRADCIDTPDPTRKNDRIDMLEPRCRKLRMELLDPNRTNTG